MVELPRRVPQGGVIADAGAVPLEETLPAVTGSGPDGRPRRDSNSRSRLRRAVLYPLSYGGQLATNRGLVVGRKAMYQRASGDPLTTAQAIML